MPHVNLYEGPRKRVSKDSLTKLNSILTLITLPSHIKKNTKKIRNKKTHVIPIVQNVNNTICTVSEPPRIDALPTSEDAIVAFRNALCVFCLGIYHNLTKNQAP